MTCNMYLVIHRLKIVSKKCCISRLLVLLLEYNKGKVMNNMNNIYFTVAISLPDHDETMVAGKLTQSQIDKLTEYFKELAEENRAYLS